MQFHTISLPLAAIFALQTPFLVLADSFPQAKVQCDNYNARTGSVSHKESKRIIEATSFDNATKHAVQMAIDFERSNWATGSIHKDPFYELPDTATLNTPPGSLLKVERTTNITSFTTPPKVALSRILFQTADLNGTSIPASGFVLWPWMARKFDNINGVPVVAWAHGTSGIAGGECAPSHIRNLWYQYSAPFILALAGYAVVAPDYAGMGVTKRADGKLIPHQWGANPAGANDLFYAVEAAQKAFPVLSKEFVTFGHSQGGGIAWGSAIRQAKKPVDGHLGTIAGSPAPDLLKFLANPGELYNLVVMALANTAESIFSSFKLRDWLSHEAIEAFGLYKNLSGCMSVAEELLIYPSGYAKKNLANVSYYLKALNDLVALTGRPFANPLLVLHGTADQVIPVKDVDEMVNATCKALPHSQLQFMKFKGADHVPTMYASQQIWLDWIADRFSGKEVARGCSEVTHSPVMATTSYQAETAYFLQHPLYAYETA